MEVVDNRHVPAIRSGESGMHKGLLLTLSQDSMTTKHFCLFLIKEFEENALLTVHILPKHKEGRKGDRE